MLTEPVQSKLQPIHYAVIEQADFIVESGQKLQRRPLAELVGLDVRALDRVVEFLRGLGLFPHRFQRGRDYRAETKSAEHGWQPTPREAEELEIRKLQERVKTRFECGLDRCSGGTRRPTTRHSATKCRRLLRRGLDTRPPSPEDKPGVCHIAVRFGDRKSVCRERVC